MTTEREVRKLLVEALEGLEDGWLYDSVTPDGTSYQSCYVCRAEGSHRTPLEHRSGCPVPPAYAALEAARALDEVKA